MARLSIKAGGRVRERGIALVMVLWFVAGLTLLATSVVSMMQVDVRATAHVNAQLRAATLGDAAIQLALLEADADPTIIDAGVRRSYEFEDEVVTVTIRRDSGFINLNAAGPELLRDLLRFQGGLEAAAAERLAQAIVAWRGTDIAFEWDRYANAGLPHRPRGGPFEAPEDLLQVMGFDRSLYAKIDAFVTVYGMSASVDPRFAPVQVLTVLAQGDQALARSIYEAIQSGEVGVDTSMLNPDYLADTRSTSILRLDAAMEVDGFLFTRLRWMKRQPGSRRGGWQTMHVSLGRGGAGADTGYGR